MTALLGLSSTMELLSEELQSHQILSALRVIGALRGGNCRENMLVRLALPATALRARRAEGELFAN